MSLLQRKADYHAGGRAGRHSYFYNTYLLHEGIRPDEGFYRPDIYLLDVPQAKTKHVLKKGSGRFNSGRSGRKQGNKRHRKRTFFTGAFRASRLMERQFRL